MTRDDSPLSMTEEIAPGRGNHDAVKIKRAYTILKMYMDLEKPTPELEQLFYDWLTDVEGSTEYQIALRRVFDEIVQ